MELGSHIKEHRTELGLSQDDLAERIYVSRQTISNWECGRTYPDVQSLLLLSNVFGVTVDSLIKGDVEMAERIYVSRQTISNWECGRTYPDVQSLLLLSNVFGVTVDSLIKGDVETMAQVMNEAVKKYNALSTITVVSAVVFLGLSAWAAFQFEWGWGAHIAPTAAFAAVALVVMLVAFVYMERMKKQHDLVTYREVLAFSRGEQVERDTLEGHREREMTRPRHVPRGAGVQPRRAGRARHARGTPRARDEPLDQGRAQRRADHPRRDRRRHGWRRHRHARQDVELGRSADRMAFRRHDHPRSRPSWQNGGDSR